MIKIRFLTLYRVNSKNQFENKFDPNSLYIINLYNSLMPKLNINILNLFQI
ncbi:hypothetical protein F2N08_02945 [Campylobacter hyointestinalis subsp. hyointestinalis]|nr:hypothetical protein [Campylobacter hyointestinalis subsp. hyointestinalis]